MNPQCLSSHTNITHHDCQSLYDTLKIDELYFLATGGGVTFGGGEPCVYSDFIAQFRNVCGDKWQIAVETSLNIARSHLETLLPVVDNYIIDIKDTDPQIYKSYTESDNTLVMNNLKWLIEMGKTEQLRVRVPLIPNFNTTQDVEHSIEILTKMGVQSIDQFTYIIR